MVTHAPRAPVLEGETMRTQQEYLRLGPHNKTVTWPLISEWGELFASYTLDETCKPAPHTFKIEGERHPCTIGPWMRTEFANSQQTINGYTSPRYRMGPYVYVRMHEDRARAAFEDTIGIVDGLSFRLIQWNDREAVVILEHSCIIGSRWLAVIDPNTIPADIREAR